MARVQHVVRLLLVPLWLLLAPVASEAVDAEKAEGCTITASACKNFPEFRRTTFRDSVGEEHLGAQDNDASCFKRAEDFHYWCGNGPDSGATVAATHNPSQTSQIFHPKACENGWSLWDAFCYKHYWEKKNWFEAEALCRERGAHLASVHSRAENRFIFTLTSGLSAWIGYTDLDQDTHFQWSDNTQDDFTNFAKNCTGREHEPDCKPEETQQQWYDWNGADQGTFVCKRNALLPIGLLRNITAKDLTLKPWVSLLPALAAAGALENGSCAGTCSAPAAALPELKVDTIPPASPGGAKTTAERPAVGGGAPPEPRLAMPKSAFR